MIENLSKVATKPVYAMHNFWHYELLLIGDNSIKVSNILIAILLTIVGFYFSNIVSKFLKKVLGKVINDRDALNAVHKVAFYILFFFYIIIILEIANIPLNVFAFIGGALAISAGLGTQQLLNNFISGILIIVEKPIKVGDVVEVFGVVGMVKSIGGRSTILKQFNGTTIVVPNSTIMQQHLTNWNYSEKNLHVEIIIKVEISNRSEKSHKKILDQIQKAANSVKLFEKLKEPQVSLSSIKKGEDDFILSIEIPENKIREINRVKTDLNFALIKQLNDEFSVIYPNYLE